MNQIKLVLLDRDGVINHDSPDYILSPEQWLPIDGSLQAIAQLKQANIATAVCSNQSALGRGMIGQRVFDAIQQKMVKATQEAGGDFDYLAYCPHGPDDGCACRKPKAGMLNDAIQAIGAHLNKDEIVMIGDSLRDIEAAKGAGVKSMLVATGYGDAQQIYEKAKAIEPDIQLYADLASCVADILGDK
ncbi:MAG: D-glycero-beta-D-manno-heptose 1,7-bisphosphate 7-phosphatase [Ghiorsea sp.]